MQVIIGVDPHKASHTAVAISTTEDELARKKVRATRTQVDQLLAWAEPFPTRLWAIEGADGMGYLLAQQLVATGEHVLSVPDAATVERLRLTATGLGPVLEKSRRTRRAPPRERDRIGRAGGRPSAVKGPVPALAAPLPTPC